MDKFLIGVMVGAVLLEVVVFFILYRFFGVSKRAEGKEKTDA